MINYMLFVRFLSLLFSCDWVRDKGVGGGCQWVWVGVYGKRRLEVVLGTKAKIG